MGEGVHQYAKIMKNSCNAAGRRFGDAITPLDLHAHDLLIRFDCLVPHLHHQP